MHGESFRPLTGTLLSKPVRTDRALKALLSFRPLTGTLLSKHKEPEDFRSETRTSFRPLTGTLLSKQNKKYFISNKRRVSVPSRGLSYLNLIYENTENEDIM